ncbi:MAG: hypothetical protein IJK32_02360, partial [Bacteroidales bacterium]|nr:hypothetical protein [Bacteroidales bacterium]
KSDLPRRPQSYAYPYENVIDQKSLRMNTLKFNQYSRETFLFGFQLERKIYAFPGPEGSE